MRQTLFVALECKFQARTYKSNTKLTKYTTDYMLIEIDTKGLAKEEGKLELLKLQRVEAIRLKYLNVS